MVLIQHLFGISSLRQTYREIRANLAYRWFLGYGLLDEIPHFATVSYAFCKRFPEELAAEIFEHILNKAQIHKVYIFSAGTLHFPRTVDSTGAGVLHYFEQKPG